MVEDSVLMPGARIEAKARVRKAIIGSNAVIGEGCLIGEWGNSLEETPLTVIGEGDKVLARAKVSSQNGHGRFK